jgi:hypothetical protein
LHKRYSYTVEWNYTIFFIQLSLYQE